MFINLLLWEERVTRVGSTMFSGILTAISMFTIFVSRASLRLSSNECQFKSFRRFVTVAVFESGGWPLNSFNIVAMVFTITADRITAPCAPN